MKRPFRVLIIEDLFAKVEPLVGNGTVDKNQSLYFLNRLRDRAKAISSIPSETPLSILWSPNISFSQKFLLDKSAPVKEDCVYELFGSVSADKRFKLIGKDTDLGISLLHCENGISDLLQSTDILVLDLGGVGNVKPQVSEDKVRANFAEAFKGSEHKLGKIGSADIDKINEDYSGVGFFHARYNDLKSCQFVIVVTQYNNDSGEQEVISQLLNPFCGLEDHAPFTVKFGRDNSDQVSFSEVLAERVIRLFEDYLDGYTQLRNLGQIEFAAQHDSPVLIVGESGTGKECVSRSIHRRWADELKRRNEFKSSQLDRNRFVTVNCAGLSAELARTELFGHLKGAFTGASTHKLGAILVACGLKLGKAQGDEEGFAEKLQIENKDLLKAYSDAEEGVIEFKEQGPFGTVFLDEFGDLAPEVQNMLLRYLEDKTSEVEIVGCVRRIRGAKVRIIAATSDPRVAQFAGHKLKGAWRSPDEMQRGLRQDLLSRIKGQVIRTPGCDNRKPSKNIGGND